MLLAPLQLVLLLPVPAIHVLAVIPMFHKPPWISFLPFCHGGDCSHDGDCFHNELVVLGALAERVCSCSEYAELGLMVG